MNTSRCMISLCLDADDDSFLRKTSVVVGLGDDQIFCVCIKFETRALMPTVRVSR